MIDGSKVRIQGIEYIIPPLNFAGMRQVKEKAQLISSPHTDTFDRLDAMMDLIKLALRRNYTAEELSDDTIESIIDLSNINLVFDCVMAVSGMVKAKGEQEPGE
jgi:hypothetical protein